MRVYLIASLKDKQDAANQQLGLINTHIHRDRDSNSEHALQFERGRERGGESAGERERARKGKSVLKYRQMLCETFWQLKQDTKF